MEVDRINQVQGLKRVERTGSEAERRRHQRPDEEFNELLEQSLKDGNGGEQQNGTGHNGNGGSGHLPVATPTPLAAAELPRDTVSLSTSAALNPVATTDIVSISTAAMVSSESLKATNGTLRLSLVQAAAHGLRHLVLAPPASATAEKPQPTEPVPEASPPPAPGSLDTLA
jgi:hypothetical protein